MLQELRLDGQVLLQEELQEVHEVAKDTATQVEDGGGAGDPGVYENGTAEESLELSQVGYNSLDDCYIRYFPFKCAVPHMFNIYYVFTNTGHD